MEQLHEFKRYLQSNSLAANTIESYVWTVEHFFEKHNKVSENTLLEYKGYLMEKFSPNVTAKLFCHRNCSPKLSKNIKKLLPIMPSITAHMSYLFWSPKEKRLVHPTRDVNWRRFQEDFEEILEA